MKELILEARHLTKAYPSGGSKELAVLDDINLSVREGEFIAILGASGAGKSSLLRILAGLSEPTRGGVFFRNKPLKEASPRFAMVFQSFALFPWLTIIENVMLGLKAYKVPDSEARDRSEQMLALVGLEGFEDAYPRELSGGMRQRVGLARALVMEPEVLFMDEPFSALDVLTADNLRGELVSLWTEKKMPIRSIIFVTHNIDEAVFMAERAVILSHNPGRVKADISLEIPQSKGRDSKEFKYMVDRIYTILSKPSEEVSLLLEQGKFQFLPHSRVGAIAGLLELVHDKGDRIDLSDLSSELSMEVDDIFPLIEATVFLGFGEIREGDFFVTAKGRDFSEADAREKKEVFRETALSNIQLIKQIIQVLSSTAKHRMSEEFFLEILENHFTKEEAWKQLETAIDWGRYAELFGYDYHSGELSFEEEEGEEPQ
ncbi:MAG: nitrate/sulfonate/bicarbonate ABC transporter ATP-binding protein [Thermodesulfovibrionales bacterium]|jgi:NitT/TauT family transport system ATP-binding protein